MATMQGAVGSRARKRTQRTILSAADPARSGQHGPIGPTFSARNVTAACRDMTVRGSRPALGPDARPGPKGGYRRCGACAGGQTTTGSGGSSAIRRRVATV
ncbi:MAG: hypothetical protein QOJ79_1178 [Actinomycetota bacterium]|jgi:hypothetical protein|nr:hypothetical protein [Actinomycetota bacterium]